MILVTGSQGLIGQCLLRHLHEAGIAVREFDIRRNQREDIRSVDVVRQALDGVQGVVHLAAVSRVVWAELYPDTAYSVNVGGLKTLLNAVKEKKKSTMGYIRQQQRGLWQRSGITRP